MRFCVLLPPPTAHLPIPVLPVCVRVEYLQSANRAHFLYMYLNLEGFRQSAAQQINKHRIEHSLRSIDSPASCETFENARSSSQRDAVRSAELYLTGGGSRTEAVAVGRRSSPAVSVSAASSKSPTDRSSSASSAAAEYASSEVAALDRQNIREAAQALLDQYLGPEACLLSALFENYCCGFFFLTSLVSYS